MDTKDAPEWTMSQERQFMENLVQQRFNFLLAIFALVIAGAANAQSRIYQLLALIVGLVLCTVLSLCVIRAHLVLDRILNRLRVTDNHPVKVIGDDLGTTWLTWRMSPYIGIRIPIMCLIVLVIMIVFSVLGKLDVKGNADQMATMSKRVSKVEDRQDDLLRQIASLKTQLATKRPNSLRVPKPSP